MTTHTIATDRPINRLAVDIAEEIIRLGIAPTDYLAAYLSPLFCITDLSQAYGYDSAAGIAGYCVDALESQAGWRGPRAKCLLTNRYIERSWRAKQDANPARRPRPARSAAPARCPTS